MPTVFRASKTVALTVVQTAAADGVARPAAAARARGSAPTGVAIRALTSARRIEARTRAPILVRIGARTQGQISVRTVVQAVETAAPTVVPIAEPTVAQATMLSAPIAVLNTTVMQTVGSEVSRARRVDPTARRLWRELAEPAEWLMAGQMVEPTVEPMAAQRPATARTAQPPIQTSIATILNGGLSRIDRAS